MFVRFVGYKIDETSRQRIGIFALAYRLLRRGELSSHDRDALTAHVVWLEKNLAIPTRFTPYRLDVPHREPIAISWFKPAAKEHIERCWQVRGILVRYGIDVEMVRTRKPGYVTYEDEWQVVAMPFAGDGAAT